MVGGGWGRHGLSQGLEAGGPQRPLALVPFGIFNRSYLFPLLPLWVPGLLGPLPHPPRPLTPEALAQGHAAAR